MTVRRLTSADTFVLDLAEDAEVISGAVQLSPGTLTDPAIKADIAALDASVVALDASVIALDASVLALQTGKVSEAPIDGTTYGRLNGNWAPISSGSVTGLVYVDDVAKLPTAVAGVRTLAAHTAYYFTAPIDLLGDRIVLSDSTVLLGTSSETAILRSTGLGAATPFITAAHGGPNPIQNLAIYDVGTVFDIDGLGGANAALDWLALNLFNCGSFGTIKNITNLVINTSAFLDCGGLVLDGTIATAAWFQTIWTLPVGSGATAVRVPSTCTITRRMRWTYSPMLVPVGCTGFEIVDRNASFPVAESFGLLFGNFTGGGTYLTGASYADDKTVVQSTLGLINGAPSANYFMNGNATPTAVASTGVFYKIAGAPAAGSYLSKFTVSGNRATYTGSVSRFFRVAASVALTAGNNHVVALRFAVDGSTLPDTEQRTTATSGGRVESMSTLGIVLLAPGSYVELWVANQSASTNITVTDLQVTISAVAG